MKSIRWGIIGVGRFGSIHARAIRSLPGSELVALANRNPERLAAAREEFGVADCYSDYRDLLANPDVDVVSITTHWKDHHEIALAALAAGKHVFLEKPMAASSAECLELVSAAESSEGFLMIGHICRFDPRVTLAKEAIAAGRIGRIVSMHARRNLPKAPGNIRLDKISPLIGDGIHDIDLMLWFTGKTPTEVYGRNVKVSDHTYPDLGWAMLHFGEEAIGVVETVWCLPENVPTTIDARFEIIGTSGTLSIDAAHTGLTILDANGAKMPDTVYWPTQHGRQIGALSVELGYFANCVRTGTAPDVVTPLEAARAFAVAETAEKSALAGKVLPFVFG